MGDKELLQAVAYEHRRMICITAPTQAWHMTCIMAPTRHDAEHHFGHGCPCLPVYLQMHPSISAMAAVSHSDVMMHTPNTV